MNPPLRRNKVHTPSIIALCGLPGSGKSTVGALLASHLDYSFQDTDRIIEHIYETKTGRKKSCREIQQSEGEPRFRAIESQALQPFFCTNRQVIATGGGIVLEPSNRHFLSSLSYVIYLQATPEFILPRLLMNGIPSYLNPDHLIESYQTLAKIRIPLYEEICHLKIPIEDMLPEKIAHMICSKIKE